ncbi:M23 family metallopeptidase [Halalkalibacter urbisdiaboli]|uniref:M23 family metallopeptidase n=1 Tax=Halalkalibacter urbisdiaboli TaxID=1960589 RepID=UPI000B44047E|nr:M23 family metallopeptidase [Halalkalibacter urbisdiaboli]
MKHIWILMFILVLLGTACQQQEAAPSENEKVVPQEENKSENENDSLSTIPVDIHFDDVMFQLNDLMEIVGGSYEFDEVHRTLKIKIHDDEYTLIDGVNVLERNGEFVPRDDIYFTASQEHEIAMPVSFIEHGLQLPLSYKEDVAEFQWFGPTEKVGGPPASFGFEEWDVERMVDYLSFLEKPIKDATVSTIPSHLPGAPREYRNGYHEGIDWYDFASGGNINTDTPIYAMADGVVVRVDHDYVEYESPEERDKDLMLTSEIGETPEYIFDRLRGRQVWVQYPHGVMNRFAHLDSIPEDIKVGDRVNSETIIGYVGNSGTSDAVNNKETAGLHLHQDLLIYGELFWKPLSQEEVREVLVQIWE